jgi:myo-inositol 2-dehydrogenase/D-chiro-inositol 1-dehydrogenase
MAGSKGRAQVVNVGLIGAGRIGRVHAEHLARRLPQARLLAVSDVIREAAERCAADFGIPGVGTDPRGILEDKRIEAVVICSSTDTHAPLIEQAAAAGKHIFCEKPIALDLAVIDSALRRVESSGVKLQIGFNRRFDRNFRRIWEHLREGHVGEPYILRITSRDPAPPPMEYVRVSGGIFLDMMIHDFDMARYLMGAEVEEVYTVGAVRVDPRIGEAGDLDTAVVTLRFDNGALGAIDNCRQAVYGYDQRVEVLGSKGMVSTGNETPDRTSLSTSEAVQTPLPLHFFMERYIDSYINEMREFIGCLLEDRPVPVTGRDGRVPVVMGKAARLSWEENRPVRLEEISGGP